MTRHNILPNVRALSAYTLKQRLARTKLNQNESPFDLDPDVKDSIWKRVRAMDWNRYPDFHPEDVLEALGKRHGVSSDQVLIGNGSNELLQATFAATVEPGVTVSLPAPTFSLYKMLVQSCGGTADLVYLDTAMGYDMDAYMRRAALKDRHLVLCSPNNPTGSLVDPEDIRALCKTTDRLVIVDEAYTEFAPSGSSCTPLLATYPNLIVLRTFSKALGLAGIRFGYALGDVQVMREISKVKLPYNVGHFTLEAVRAFLRLNNPTQRPRNTILAERERIATKLAATGVHVFPSHANFILFRTPHAQALWEGLAAREILIRDVSHYPKLRNCLRVTVGTPQENDLFLHATRDILAQLPTTDSTP